MCVWSGVFCCLFCFLLGCFLLSLVFLDNVFLVLIIFNFVFNITIMVHIYAAYCSLHLTYPVTVGTYQYQKQHHHSCIVYYYGTLPSKMSHIGTFCHFEIFIIYHSGEHTILFKVMQKLSKLIHWSCYYNILQLQPPQHLFLRD